MRGKYKYKYSCQCINPARDRSLQRCRGKRIKDENGKPGPCTSYWTNTIEVKDICPLHTMMEQGKAKLVRKGDKTYIDWMD